MWKVLQSVPRGIRNGLTNYARRHTCWEEEKDPCLNVHQYSVTTCRHNNSQHDHQQDEQKFRIHNERWNVRDGHTLLEALGLGAALTAGIIASRPSLPNPTPDGHDQRRRNLLLECAAAMPINPTALAINDRSPVQKVRRCDSGFSETRPIESPPIPDDLHLSPPSSGPDSVHSDISWDSSHSGSLSSRSSIDSYRRQFDALWSPLDVYHSGRGDEVVDNDGPKYGPKRLESTNCNDSEIVVEQCGESAQQKQTKNEPASLADAYRQFEDSCRDAYGRHCNYCAIKALKADDDIGAVHHWLKSSRFGYDKGQYNLARCYQDGIGTYKDLDKAKYYYSLAAAQGHRAATERLHRLLDAETGAKLIQKWTSAETAVKCHQQDSRILR